MMSKKKQLFKSLPKKTLKMDWGCLVPLFFVVLFFGGILYHQMTHFLINRMGETVTGYITTEKYIIGNSKIIRNDSYTFGYAFSVKGKEYTGNSRRKNLPIGSQVEIEYVPFCPIMSRLKRNQ